MKTDTDGILIMLWNDWEYHPAWLTEKQHKERGLIPGGEPVAKVWYINKYLPEGHWLLLFDVGLAQPKVVSAEKAAALARGKETALRNRACPLCGHVREYKIALSDTYGLLMCNACRDLQDEIVQARNWLADDSIIFLDTETNGLHGEPVQIGLLAITGTVLLDTLVHPHDPIDESEYEWTEGWNGEEYQKPTAFAIHGISNERVKDAPTFPQVWQQLAPLLKGKRLLIFNADYDLRCLEYALRVNEMTEDNIAGSAECVMRWYAAYHGEWSRKYRDYKFISLEVALDEQEVEIEAPAHNALGDCQRTLALIRKIAGKQAPLDKKE